MAFELDAVSSVLRHELFRPKARPWPEFTVWGHVAGAAVVDLVVFLAVSAFLRRLANDAGQKVFLIVDNLKVHHAGKVEAWVVAHAHEIELFHLPAYAPDHNPDEYFNNDLKQKLRQQPEPASKDELLKSSCAVLRAIQRSPRRILGYFKPPAVRYAA